MHVHITYTGGTIGMVDSPHGLVSGADLEGWLDSQLAGTPLARSVSVTSLEPLIDSSNATPLSWQAVVDDLRAQAVDNPEAAFVVLHGTDTMAYTSAALSYALTDLAAPVVVTGSQLPLGVLGTDLLNDAPPQASGIDQNIVLVHICQLFSRTCLGFGERVPDDPLDPEGRVDGNLARDLLRGSLTHHATVSAIHPFGSLANHEEVDLAGFSKRRRNPGIMPIWAQVDVMIESEAQLEKQPPLKHARRHAGVPDGA